MINLGRSGGISYRGRRACIRRSGGTEARRSWICSVASCGWPLWSLPARFGSHLTSYIPDYLTPILALAELARRCVWGFFRLEHEHLSNAFQHRREGQFAATASADARSAESSNASCRSSRRDLLLL